MKHVKQVTAQHPAKACIEELQTKIDDLLGDVIPKKEETEE